MSRIFILSDRMTAVRNDESLIFCPFVERRGSESFALRLQRDDKKKKKPTGHCYVIITDRKQV